MKKIISTFALLVLAFGVACANVDRPIKADQLPAPAQEFIKQHFSKSTISFAKIDDELTYKEYEVMLADGTKLEFNGDGEWKDVDCKYGAVPAAIVPKQIKDYLAQNYPQAVVLGIDYERKQYEVRLNNHLELTFDKNFRLIDIDD